MQKYYYFFSEGSNINQLLCAILINLPVFAYGACVGWMSPMTLLLQSKDSPRGEPLTDNEISWMAAASYLVCVPMDYVMAYVGDKIGRKITLILMSGTCIALWVIKLSSLNTWALVASRALVGISMAGAFVTCPAYTKEISEDSIRGFLGTLVIVFQTSGNLFIYIIGDLLSYHTVLWICLSLPMIHITLFLWMPESPSYLVKIGRDGDAAKAIAWLRCRNEQDIKVQSELEQIKMEQRNDESSGDSILMAIFKDKILFRAFKIVIEIILAREVCGIITVSNFAGDIFSMASTGSGLFLTPNQQAMLLGVVQVAGALLASSVVETTGRKPLLVITSVISGVSMFALASWFLFREYGIFAPGWLPVVMLCLCIFCDASGLQPISVVVTGEIFSFKYRGTVMALSMGVGSVADFLQLYFFKPISASIGVHVVFYFFAGICLMNAIYVLLVVPETKMRSLNEIYDDLKTKKEKQKQIETEKCIREITVL